MLRPTVSIIAVRRSISFTNCSAFPPRWPPYCPSLATTFLTMLSRQSAANSKVSPAWLTCLSSLQHDTTFPFDWWTSWLCQYVGIGIPALPASLGLSAAATADVLCLMCQVTIRTRALNTAAPHQRRTQALCGFPIKTLQNIKCTACQP